SPLKFYAETFSIKKPPELNHGGFFMHLSLFGRSADYFTFNINKLHRSFRIGFDGQTLTERSQGSCVIGNSDRSAFSFFNWSFGKFRNSTSAYTLYIRDYQRLIADIRELKIKTYRSSLRDLSKIMCFFLEFE